MTEPKTRNNGLTPAQMAAAFRIWQFAEPIGWDCNVTEIAAATGLAPNFAGRILTLKGWKNRIRVDGSSQITLASGSGGKSLRFDVRFAEVAQQTHAEIENWRATMVTSDD